MNTSCQKYENLAAEFPSEKDAINRLRDLFQAATPEQVYSIGRLIDLIQPTATHYFPTLLRRAEEEDLILGYVRVESPAMGGIDDFKSIVDIPDQIYDQHQGQNIPVTPDLLKAVYKPFTDPQ